MQVLEIVRVEDWLPGRCAGGRGRSQQQRAALARAFLAKAVFGWERAAALPSEATFSRAFAEFAASELPGQVHEALVERSLQGHLAGHVSRDSTAIPVREQPARKPKQIKQKRKRGRPRKGAHRPASEPRRLERQGAMTGRSADGLRQRREAQCQGASGTLAGVQVAH